MPQTENQFRYFAEKGEHGELWLDEQPPHVKDFMITDDFDGADMIMGEEYKKAINEWNSRLHYSCSPELKAMLADGSIVPQRLFGLKYEIDLKGEGDYQETTKENYDRFPGYKQAIAIPLPDKNSFGKALDEVPREVREALKDFEKEDKPERLFTLQQMYNIANHFYGSDWPLDRSTFDEYIKNNQP